MNEQLRKEFDNRTKSLKLTKEATEELFLKFKVSFFDEGFPCVYCNKRMELKWGSELSFTIDHTIPKAKNGEDVCDNLEFICFQCNSMKADKDAEWFVNNVKRLKLRKQKSEQFKARKATTKDEQTRDAYKDIFERVKAKKEEYALLSHNNREKGIVLSKHVTSVEGYFIVWAQMISKEGKVMGIGSFQQKQNFNRKRGDWCKTLQKRITARHKNTKDLKKGW